MNFKVGDVLKTRMDIAEDVYEGCKGTTVYDKMMELARTKRFEVIADNGTQYVLRHLGTDPLVELPYDRDEVHSYMEKDESYDEDGDQETNE